MTQLDNAVQQTDENGHRIVALKYMFLAGFLRILYWPRPTMTAVTMVLVSAVAHGMRCWCALDRTRAAAYSIDVGNRLQFFL